MPEDIANDFSGYRSLEEALADLQTAHERRPKDEDLARMIRHAKAEIADRQHKPLT